MANAPERPSDDRSRPSKSGPEPTHSSQGARDGNEPKRDRPRTDTIALVEANASKAREVPTWLAVIAIVALSLVAGMTTYLVRLKTTSDTPPAATASAESRSARSIGPDDPSGAKR